MQKLSLSFPGSGGINIENSWEYVCEAIFVLGPKRPAQQRNHSDCPRSYQSCLREPAQSLACHCALTLELMAPPPCSLCGSLQNAALSHAQLTAPRPQLPATVEKKKDLEADLVYLKMKFDLLPFAYPLCSDPSAAGFARTSPGRPRLPAISSQRPALARQGGAM